MEELTCFVIIGYGEKTDHRSGRMLNLTNSYKNLIRPVLKNLGIQVFRGIDKNYESSGFIDTKMYGFLLKSDLVIADVSTLNPNAIYELGIRHALRPYSTIIISEKGTEIPFDFGRNVIETYQHLGDDIGVTESKRFKKRLKRKIKAILELGEVDSPVYTLFPNLEPPKFSKEELKVLVKEEDKLEKTATALSVYLENGELAKNDGQYEVAEKHFRKALKIDPTGIFIRQRIALVTYKSKVRDPLVALSSAKKILEGLDNHITTDPETLGLSGAVYKRLFDIDNDYKTFNKSLYFYERGFYIKQDYYNGINVAFMYTKRAAALQVDKTEAQTDYLLANRVRTEVLTICEGLINSERFNERGDKNWIYLTKAEAHLGLGNIIEEENTLTIAEENLEGEFDRDSYLEQKKKLELMIELYNSKWNNPNN